MISGDGFRMIFHTRRRAAVTALGLLLAGCGTVEPFDDLREELERNEQLWGDVGPLNYVYTIERQCFCGVEARGPVRVTASGPIATSRIYVDTEEPVEASFAGLFPTVEGLFAFIGDAIARGAHDIDVTYDLETGVPLTVFVDYAAHVADEEIGYVVREAPSAPMP